MGDLGSFTCRQLLLFNIITHELKTYQNLRPPPAKEAKPYQVEQARDFLTTIGFKP